MVHVPSRRETAAQFDPFSGEVVASDSLEITITWCASEALSPNSRSIAANGVTVTGSFSYTALGGTMPCFDVDGTKRGESVGKVALEEGVNLVVATICSSVVCGTDSATYTRTPPPEPAPPQSLRVTPDTVSIVTAAFATDTQRFVVKSLVGSSMTVTLAATCDRLAMPTCTPSASSVNLNAGDSTFVDVVYTAGPVGTTGPVRLRAHRSTDPHDQDDGSAQLTVGAGAPGATRVRVLEAQRATAIAKDRCLTAALTKETAASCGDLRVVHPLPAIAVRNRVRQPVLLYDSRTASGTALLAAAVTLPSGATPTKVTATLSVQDTAGSWATATTGDWAGTPFTPGVAVRIALAWPMASADAGGSGTRLVPYRLDVTAWDGGTPRAAVRDSGSFAYVDRSTSPFGAGWWLAGLERLYSTKGAAPSTSDTTLLWVGGDGSTRRFRTVAASTWVADTVDAPDTLRWVGDSSWFERRLPGGTRVRFGTSGRHANTTDRLGIQTTFAYDGSGRLTSITPAGLAAATHHLAYAGDSAVAICAQGNCASGTTRRDSLLLTAGRIDTIRGVGGTVRFMTDSLRRITARWDRRGTKTAFAYVGRAGLVDTATTDSAGTAWRRLTFVHGQGAGLGSPTAQVTAVPLLDVATRLDGPRTDVGDTTRVWLDAFGAPRRIRDAVFRTSVLSRGDRTYPAVVTEQRAPNGFTTWAMYDARGNVVVHGAQWPYGDSRNPRTTYAWDATWDAVTRATNPAGDWSGALYDATSGNPTKVFGMRGDTVRFTYLGGAGITRGLVDSVKQPFGIVEAYSYDSLGNVDTLIAPDGVVTAIVRDALGRDTLRVVPIQDTLVERVRTTYDTRDRVTGVLRVGPAMDYVLRTFSNDTIAVPAESIAVSHLYDAEDNVVETATEGHGEPSANQVETYAYDLAHALIARENGGSWVTTTLRDKAGHVVATQVPGETLWVTASYDAIGRVTQRITPSKSHAATACTGYPTGPLNWLSCLMEFPLFPNDGGTGYVVPADTAVFTYDTTGAIATAVNAHAAIRRTYFPGGALRTDSSETFGFRVTYDWNGRRTRVMVGPDTLELAYHVFGPLRKLLLPGGAWYRFTYDSLLRLDSLTVRPDEPVLPAVRERRTYDVRSRLARRHRVSADIGTLTLDSLSYDYRNRLTRVRVLSAALGDETNTYSYAGLGAVVASERTQPGGGYAIERFTTDAAGNVLASRNRTSTTLDTLPHTSGLGAHAALLDRDYGPLPLGDWADGRLYAATLSQAVDAGGRVIRAGESQQRITYSGNPPVGSPEYSRQTASRSFYGTDGRLAAVQRYGWLPGSSLDGTWEEYRYDALGRRVRTVVRRDNESLCSGSAWCASHTTHTLWDGDVPLLQYRSAPSLTRIYLPGLALDQPLGLWDGRVLNPSWRGVYESSVWTDGTAGDQSVGSGTGTLVDWPASRGVYWNPGPGSGDAMPPLYTWLGDLAVNGEQSTGQLYRRNRFYDPQSGQFTQADPIGLAGGVSLFGFAAGDPVNYQDPFGLCPVDAGGDGTTEGYDDCPALSSGWWAYRIVTGQGNRFVNEFFGTLRACGEDERCGDGFGMLAGGARLSTRNVQAGRATSRTVGQMQSQVVRGQAPRSVRRVDRARHPHEQDNVHFDRGQHALNRDGTWKHGGRELTNAERQWLQEAGWTLPPQ